MSGAYSSYVTSEQRKTAIAELCRSPKRLYEIRSALGAHQDVVEQLVSEMETAVQLTRQIAHENGVNVDNNNDKFQTVA